MQKECPAALFGGMTSNNGGGAGGTIAKMAGSEAAALWDTHADRQRFGTRPGA
jgi:hypothetical protein